MSSKNEKINIFKSIYSDTFVYFWVHSLFLCSVSRITHYFILKHKIIFYEREFSTVFSMIVGSLRPGEPTFSFEALDSYEFGIWPFVIRNVSITESRYGIRLESFNSEKILFWNIFRVIWNFRNIAWRSRRYAVFALGATHLGLLLLILTNSLYDYRSIAEFIFWHISKIFHCFRWYVLI